MTDTRAAEQLAHDIVFVEIAGDVAHRPVRMEMRAVIAGDARRFLAAMLEGIEPERDEACGIVGTPDAEIPALFVQRIPV